MQDIKYLTEITIRNFEKTAETMDIMAAGLYSLKKAYDQYRVLDLTVVDSIIGNLNSSLISLNNQISELKGQPLQDSKVHKSDLDYYELDLLYNLIYKVGGPDKFFSGLADILENLINFKEKFNLDEKNK